MVIYSNEDKAGNFMNIYLFTTPKVFLPVLTSHTNLQQPKASLVASRLFMEDETF